MSPRQYTMSGEICSVCALKFTKSKRVPIECPHCHFIACKQCCVVYVSGLVVPKCMNNACEELWNKEFVRQDLGKSVLGALRENEVQMLFDEQRADLMQYRTVHEKAILRATQLREELGATRGELQGLHARLLEVENNIALYEEQEKELSRELDELIEKPHPAGNLPCPNDRCPGVIIFGECQMCRLRTCADCHESVVGEHKCDEGLRASIKLALENSKLCPKCRTPIERVSGCRHMFCTSCHTKFDWETGKIYTASDSFSNPHHSEFLANNKISQPGNDSIDNIIRYIRRNYNTLTTTPNGQIFDRVSRVAGVAPYTPTTSNREIVHKLAFGEIDEAGAKKRIYKLKYDVIVGRATDEIRQIFLTRACEALLAIAEVANQGNFYEASAMVSGLLTLARDANRMLNEQVYEVYSVPRPYVIDLSNDNGWRLVSKAELHRICSPM